MPPPGHSAQSSRPQELGGAGHTSTHPLLSPLRESGGKSPRMPLGLEGFMITPRPAFSSPKPEGRETMSPTHPFAGHARLFPSFSHHLRVVSHPDAALGSEGFPIASVQVPG